MKNTKFRKRALLSSVAMLLVALVAVGSATFAWFVNDPTADATGLSATSQSSTGLQIKSESSTGWSHHAKIACATSEAGGDAIDGIILVPSILNKKDNKFYSVKATAANAPDADPTENWTEATTLNHQSGNGVYHETITLRKTGNASATEDVYLNGIDLGTTGSMANAVAVLLYVDSTWYCFRKNNTALPAMNETIAAGTTAYSDPSASDNITAKTAGTGWNTKATATKIGTFASGTNVEKTVELYVLLDGTHSSVYSDNAVSAADIITKCDLYFALDSNFGS